MDVRVDGGEVQIMMDLRDLEDVMEDLKYVAEQEGLEPRTEDLVNALAAAGVKW
jgi:DNA polymerase III delta prime subunit